MLNSSIDSFRLVAACAMALILPSSAAGVPAAHAAGQAAQVLPASGGVLVLPSGDITGTADATNIATALDQVVPGETVWLAPGHFYVGAGIVVDGFHGTLRGTKSHSGDDLLTTLEAVAPFEFPHATVYAGGMVLPAMLFFEFPQREVVVRDIAFVASAAEYLPSRFAWGRTTTALDHFIADFGGDADASYINLRLIAGAGDYRGSNVVIGIHSMRGPARPAGYDRLPDPSARGRGDALVNGIETSGIANYSVLLMWYRDGTIDVRDLNTERSVSLALWGLIDMDTTARDIVSTNSWRSLWFGFISGGRTTVRGFNALGGLAPSVFLMAVEGLDLRGSEIRAVDGLGESWRSPVYVRGGNRDITISDLAIVGPVDVPYAGIQVRPAFGNREIVLRDNTYDRANFVDGSTGPYAIVLGSDDSLVVEPMLQPGQVLDLGNGNRVKTGG